MPTVGNDAPKRCIACLRLLETVPFADKLLDVWRSNLPVRRDTCVDRSVRHIHSHKTPKAITAVEHFFSLNGKHSPDLHWSTVTAHVPGEEMRECHICTEMLPEMCFDKHKWCKKTKECLMCGRKRQVNKAAEAEDLRKRLDTFKAFVVEKAKLTKLPAKEVLGEAERLDVKTKDGIMEVLVSVLWNIEDVPAAMSAHQGLFQRFTFDNSKAQMHMLHALEKLIQREKKVRLNKTSRYVSKMQTSPSTPYQ